MTMTVIMYLDWSHMWRTSDGLSIYLSRAAQEVVQPSRVATTPRANRE